MKFLTKTLDEIFNPVTTLPKPRPLDSVDALMSTDYLGFMDQSYWSISYIESRAGFIVGALNTILNAAAPVDRLQTAEEISAFLNMTQIKRGFKNAPEDCGLELLKARLNGILEPKIQKPARESRRLAIG